LSRSGRMQWLEEQLRCERAFNEDLKARLHECETQKETGVSFGSCDKQTSGNAQEVVVRQP